MDPLSQFLDGPRASGAFALGVSMSTPWGIEVRDEAPLTIVAVRKGDATLDGVVMTAGDVALVRGPEPYVIADRVRSEPEIVIHPGQRCTTTTGEALSAPMHRGLRRWGNDADGETVLLIGTYEREGEIGRMAMRALPRVAIVRGNRADAAVVSLIERELSSDTVAQQTVLDRLLDLLLVSTIRAYVDENPVVRNASWLVDDDPVVAGALALLHEAPEKRWTVESLARHQSVSRANLAARFRSRVGVPPMAYLSEWRLTLASEHLGEPGVTVAAVGDRVGYASPFTFSVAFKRRFGRSPAQYRREQYSVSG